ncbi:hypothetical protein [Streptomyces sp. NPDC020607]|uniref:hypothetical protein n=1 Tax=Streptomyces sp. NPDC020607 TaxID=3365082 RepID=UPI0037B4440E
MKNRQGGNWTLEAQPWAAGKAFTEVSGRLTKWGLKPPPSLEALVRHLVTTVVADGGRQVSLHLAEQDGQALILALGHRPHLPGGDTEAAPAPLELDRQIMRELQELGGVASCGTEMTEEGRQVWALLDLAY